MGGLARLATREPDPGKAVAEPLLPPANPGYTADEGKRGVMRGFLGFAVTVGVAAALAGSADAQTRREPVERSAAGTVIQPTRTIIHNPNGTTTVIVVPRHRSYLDTGTEVSVGDRSFMDYMLPPGGDPGRPYWNAGPDFQGRGSFPLPGPFYIPGYNPNTPF
jgi:hypothetical protein